MTSAILGTLTAGLIALGFALVAQALLGRASRDLHGIAFAFAWNESFLIGAGACAAVLFPLSLLIPRHALEAELLLIALSGLAVAWRLIRGTKPGSPRSPGELRAILHDRLARWLLAAIAGAALFFGALNLWYGHSWDSVQVYATKAQMLFAQGGLSRHWFPEDPYDARLLAYPPLVSFYEALFSLLRGGFDLDRLKPIFSIFYVSMLLSTYAAARSLCSRRWALGTVLLAALLPPLTMGSAAGGYADMPLAAFVAAVVAASLRSQEASGWRGPLPWLIGALTTVKQEGMILALLACAAVALSWIRERPRRVTARLREHASAAAVVLAFLALRVGYVSWVHVNDLTWGPFDAAHRLRAVQSARLVASLCLRSLLDPWRWGLFWPAFAVAGVLLVGSGRLRPTLLVFATGAAILLETSVFLFTNWDIALHIQDAYPRLLAQLAPAAAVVIGAGAQWTWSSSPGEAA